jgi:rod shape-determining protein MreD
VLGGIADITPLLIAAVALYAGSVPGAATGFFTGLLLDLALGTSLGASSLVLTAVGYGVGRYREQRDPSHGLTPIPVAAAATAGYVLAYAAVSFMLSIDAPVSLLVVREMLMTVLLNALIAMPFFAVSRRVLRPVLLVEPGPRARRDSTVSSGPIGLRGLEV